MKLEAELSIDRIEILPKSKLVNVECRLTMPNLHWASKSTISVTLDYSDELDKIVDKYAEETINKLKNQEG